MRYTKKPKYKLDRQKIIVKKKKDLSPKELFEEVLRSKPRRRR